MADTPEQPQLYLVTPPEIELSSFPGTLARLLDGAEIACVRLALSTRDEDRIARAADACREVAHARDVPLVIDTHFRMVERLGLDGVHLGDGARSVRKVRKEIGAEAVVGAHCDASQHDGMTAGEAGADYVAFGPVAASLTGAGEVAEAALFAWWSQMIELPVVAEGNLTTAAVETLAPLTDFFALGEEIWGADDPLEALRTLTAPLG
ncbi:thiamine phosphate synthase [Dinoroseobacter sp. PD6]|uniref:thiamine phosphate synthase n=1 Tax=Dinoroseobacter sp. PD6 TaxID=3028384 RepID=UPI00237C12A9|nr:thiamine phosphate synthase [Dinoroseobacter sp. PD6]MDD9715653.1 thiamine phosphate synthase [Dinoroseobacter sp. PD6]